MADKLHNAEELRKMSDTQLSDLMDKFWDIDGEETYADTDAFYDWTEYVLNPELKRRRW